MENKKEYRIARFKAKYYKEKKEQLEEETPWGMSANGANADHYTSIMQYLKGRERANG